MTFDEQFIFKEHFINDLRNFIVENWGDRCPDHEKSCTVCQAWDNFDTMIASLESTVYEHRAEVINEISELDELSAKGWNVCGASSSRGTILFYLRKKK